MNFIIFIQSFFMGFIGLLLCLGTMPADTYANNKGVAKVLIMKGNVIAIPPSGENIKLKKGMWVQEGAKIQTQKKSFIKLLFTDKSQMNLGPKSEMKIEKFPKKKAGIISLMKGSLRSKVTKNYLKNDNKKSKLFIKTKSAAMGVRGTDFGVTVTPSGATNLDVISGAVSMAPISQGEFTNTNNDFLENIVSSEKSVMVTKEQTTRVDPNSNTVPSPQKIPKTKLNKLKASDIPITSQSTSNEENNKDKKEERKQERKNTKPEKKSAKQEVKEERRNTQAEKKSAKQEVKEERKNTQAEKQNTKQEVKEERKNNQAEKRSIRQEINKEKQNKKQVKVFDQKDSNRKQAVSPRRNSRIRRLNNRPPVNRPVNLNVNLKQTETQRASNFNNNLSNNNEIAPPPISPENKMAAPPPSEAINPFMIGDNKIESMGQMIENDGGALTNETYNAAPPPPTEGITYEPPPPILLNDGTLREPSSLDPTVSQESFNDSNEDLKNDDITNEPATTELIMEEVMTEGTIENMDDPILNTCDLECQRNAGIINPDGSVFSARAKICIRVGNNSANCSN